jgi:hypothetical protein
METSFITLAIVAFSGLVVFIFVIGTTTESTKNVESRVRFCR